MSFISDKPAYIIYDINGNEVSFNKMMNELNKADIIFFGELHNNSIAHWLEYEVTKELFDMGDGNLILGAEMFERDDQLIIDELFDKFYDSKKFEPEAKLWKNYKTDYKPLLDFAFDNNLKFVASNVPRRYASLVSKRGFEVLDSLSLDAKKFIAPLPISYDPEIKCYKDMLEMAGPGGAVSTSHVNENFPKAQAIKDATMAYSIAEYWRQGSQFIHYNGSYHSTNFEGIIWHLNQYVENLKIVTIETVSQKDISELEEDNMGVASFVIAIPASMTNTY